MKMIPSIEKIELGIMNSRLFNFRSNLIVFRITDGSTIVNHECDCLVMSKAGYLTEIEIKRSYADFLADFKKMHQHQDAAINNFIFLVHESFAEKVFDELVARKKLPSAIYQYDDDAFISEYKSAYEIFREMPTTKNYQEYAPQNSRRLFLEEQYQLARLGAMRYKNMTERIIKLEDKQ